MIWNKAYHANFRVYAEDTDFMGIVYHGNYLCLFERARTELLRDLGLPLTVLAEEDCHFVIHEVQLKYLHPARLDDWLMISTKVTKHSQCVMIFEQTMYNQAKILLCQGAIKVVCVNGKKKPQRLPAIFFKNT